MRIVETVDFVEKAFRHIKRKYTLEPYLVHLLEVAGTVEKAGFPEEVVMAALLHDTLEDTPITREELVSRFGEKVTVMVEALTDLPKSAGNRSFRKAQTVERLRNAPYEVKSIKLADIISNTSTIVEHDLKFAAVYLKEIDALLKVLEDGHPELYLKAKKHVDAGLMYLLL